MKEVIKGNKYGRLTVLHVDIVSLFCVCECGNHKIINRNHVLSGHTKSCGCLHRDVVSKLSRTHGMTNTSEYSSWENMKYRCNMKDDGSIKYKRYAGKGITYDIRWESFENFYEDMGDKPNSTYSIERINNNKGYYKDNCKWASKTEQARNTKQVVLIYYNGEKKSLSEWSKIIGISRTTLHNRINKLGWSVNESFNVKPSPHPKRFK